MPNPKAAGEDPDAPRCLSQGIMYSLRVVLGKSHAYNLYGNVYPAKPYSMNIQELYCWVVVVFARNANEDDFLAATPNPNPNPTWRTTSSPRPTNLGRRSGAFGLPPSP